MARVRVTEKSELSSWDAVNMCLAEIGEQERAIESIEARMQDKIDAAKLEAENEVKPYQERLKHLEHQIKLFTDEHAADLGNKKTMVLIFGKLGYRKSTSVILPKAKDKLEKIIQALKSRGMNDCVITPPEKVDKESLKKYPEAEIKAVGVDLKVKDTFWYETNRETLKDNGT